MVFGFGSPGYFSLLVFIPIFIILYFIYRKRSTGVYYSVVSEMVSDNNKDIPTKLFHLLYFLKVLGFILIIFALARPQYGFEEQRITQKSIDIVMVIDASGSMIATDFKPTRFEAAKKVLLEFVEKMKGNRIALVMFAGTAFTQCPLTFDHEIVKELVEISSMDSISYIKNTAIGDAIMVSINRFKRNKKRNKVIVLLTDGENNAGNIKPLIAAGIAREFNIKIYTIGVGTEEGVYQHGRKTKLDERTLKEIALITKGKYFNAKDPKTLSEIYDKISKMEKEKIEQYKVTRYNERFFSFLIPGLILIIVSFLIRRFIFAGV